MIAVSIDRRLVAGAVKVAAAAQERIDQELCKITAGAVQTVSQVARLIDWLKINGAELKDVRKDTIEKALTRTDLSPPARRALELRHAGAHIAASKFTRLDAWADDQDHRVRGALKYHGASTGRWASYGVQLQNIKKPNKDEGIKPDTIELITAGNYAGLEDPLRAVGEITSAAICAAPDHRFIAADFSGTESRVLGWLAGEQSKIDLWAKYDQTGDKADDPYLRLGLQFGFPIDTARGNGKTADLAFGYCGGRGAYKRFAGEDASDEDGDTG
jgi:DNA polymerase